MPTTPHVEKHFTASDAVRDIVIGMSDGLTVPFALAAGLTGIAASSSIIVTAGLAEIAAGSIAMGLGGYLAAKTDLHHFEAEKRREIEETEQIPDQEEEEVAQIFRDYGLEEEKIRPVVAAIASDQLRWVDFMMRFELGLEEPNPARARRSALTIAASYVAGGLVPLAPYMIVNRVLVALAASVAVTLLALFLFGYVKARFTAFPAARGAFQTLLVGGTAAAAAFVIARLIR
jgi:VIT1/CCC1 family predicted Fe2+/Mn2+ transporter